MSAYGGAQTLRLRRPDAVTTPKAPRHTGILQDQIRRAERPPKCPSFSFAFRILLLVRFSAAMYANIQDCDEVFNFWEPLHYLDRGTGFQTWELSPAYAIRSWAYVLQFLGPALAPVRLLGLGKRQSFFAVRIFFAFVSSACEAFFYRTVVDYIHNRVGRYMLVMMLFSAGMWNAATAFLPSSFAMYTTLLAFAYALRPPSLQDSRRTLAATTFFALGAIVGWPFALALSIPFVLEELFVFGKDIVPAEHRVSWSAKRLSRFLSSVATASLIFVPVVFIDSLAYGKLSIVPWNIIKYNIFGGADRGPELYGTEPWSFYILNLTLNFNLLTPLALISLPALLVTHTIDYKRLGLLRHGPDQSSPYTVLSMRLAPFYVWFGILTAQPHKEERFMFPAYPLLCFNAAVTLYLIRGWLEVTYIKVTKSPYQASRTSLFRLVTFTVVIVTSLVSISRIFALQRYYHAPLDVVFHFESRELPRLLNATGLLPAQPPVSNATTAPQPEQHIDLSPIKQFNLTLCLGKEWYRFPGHYLVPEGVTVEFVKSEFSGLLPKHFEESQGSGEKLWKWEKTREIPQGLNDMNKEVMDHYVDVSTCDYLIDLDFPQHPIASALEPRYATQEDTWDRVYCHPFLDARHSSLLTRTLWLPSSLWQRTNEFGDYCLLRQRDRAFSREISSASD